MTSPRNPHIGEGVMPICGEEALSERLYALEPPVEVTLYRFLTTDLGFTYEEVLESETFLLKVLP